MKSTTLKVAMPLAAIAGLLLIIGWIAGMFDEKMPPGTTPPANLSKADTVAVVKSEQLLYEPVPASIQAKQATIISSRILSRIEKIHVRAGDSVSQGQLLIELEAKDLQSRVSQANARINSVNARLTEAQQSLQRALDLKSSGAIARAELEKAQANRDALLADMTNAKQALQEAKTALGFAKIYSPIDGRIVDRFAEPGDTIQPGVQMLSIYNPLSLRVEANVRELLALPITLGQALEVYIPAMEKSLTSIVEELVPAGNTGSRSFRVKSRLPFSDGLLPGMYARVQVPAGKQTLLLIPKDRVASVGQLDVVWVHNQGIAERRFIRTGKTKNDGLIEVVSGLNEGDLLLPIQPIKNPSS